MADRYAYLYIYPYLLAHSLCSPLWKPVELESMIGMRVVKRQSTLQHVWAPVNGSTHYYCSTLTATPTLPIQRASRLSISQYVASMAIL